MHRHLILSLLLFSAAAMADAPSLSAGLGLEARMQKEVNPDYIEGKTLGQVFAQGRPTRDVLNAYGAPWQMEFLGGPISAK